MTDGEKVMLAVSHCLRLNDCSICEACPYNESNDYGCRARLRDDIVALLKAQENEIKALRLLVDWAEECDFGLDNIRWREYVTKEELDKVEDYIEKMIYVARMAVEQEGKR